MSARPDCCSLKRLNLKELTSRPVDLSFHYLDALADAGLTADKNRGKRKILPLLFLGYKY